MPINVSDVKTKKCQHEKCGGVAYLVKYYWGRGTKKYTCSRCFDDFELPIAGLNEGACG